VLWPTDKTVIVTEHLRKLVSDCTPRDFVTLSLIQFSMDARLDGKYDDALRSKSLGGPFASRIFLRTQKTAVALQVTNYARAYQNLTKQAVHYETSLALVQPSQHAPAAYKTSLPHTNACLLPNASHLSNSGHWTVSRPAQYCYEPLLPIKDTRQRAIKAHELSRPYLGSPQWPPALGIHNPIILEHRPRPHSSCNDGLHRSCRRTFYNA